MMLVEYVARNMMLAGTIDDPPQKYEKVETVEKDKTGNKQDIMNLINQYFAFEI